MKHVFGPVPSWRLGQSLGVDPIPLKTCNWNCVYCQLGRTRPLVNRREDYVPPEEVVLEVQDALAAHHADEIDWVTFVGSGEPLLHAHLGWMVREIKATTDTPVAVITNGSLLYLPEAREELSVADAVLPSLDAGTAELYRRVNRPHPEISFERHVDGLVAFRREYVGRLWMEVMLVRDFNDTEERLSEIAALLHRVQPDEIHLNAPARSPVEPWVEPPDREAVARAVSIFEMVAPVRAAHPADGTFDLSGCDTPVDAVIGIINRRIETLEPLLGAFLTPYKRAE